MARNAIDWEYMQADQAYKLSMAEFKGTVIQALKDIKEQSGNNQDSIVHLQNQINSIKLVSTVIGGVSGIVTAIVTILTYGQNK